MAKGRKTEREREGRYLRIYLDWKSIKGIKYTQH